jgi:hypothetical protein
LRCFGFRVRVKEQQIVGAASDEETNHCSAALRSVFWIATVATLPRNDRFKYAAVRNDEKNTRHPDQWGAGRARNDGKSSRARHG